MEKSLKKNEVDLTSGNLFVKILQVACPLMLSGILQLLYNAADLIVCGQFGSENAVGAISSTSSLTNLIINLFMGLSIGASVLMARNYGKQNAEACHKIVHTAMLLSPIMGLAVGALGIAISRPCLELLGTTDDVIDLSTNYLMIYFAGLPFSMVYNFGAAILRSVGDTKRPFYFLMIAGVINVLLNLLFVIVFKMNVNGVAVATIIAQGVSAALVVICLMRSEGYAKLTLKKLRFYKAELIDIIKIGVPAGVQGTLFSISNVIIQSGVNNLGTMVVNGNGAAQSLEGFVYTCMNSVAQTCVSFVSANHGAGNAAGVKKSIVYSFVLASAFGIVAGGIVLIAAKPLLGLYLKNGDGISHGYSRLLVILPTYFLCGIMDTFGSSIRGIGYSLLPAVITVFGVCVMRIVWVYTVFRIEALHNLTWLTISYPISWLLTAVVLFACLMVLQKKVFAKYNKEDAPIEEN